ncbi:DUF4190 domain-containing protein [Nocardia sp. NPDC002869]|uniref:DUF4190 domain-containing protein n=1 Tax=Nocardia sp. NPDC002869 TaxID=3161032 RepID=UPI00398D33EE
MAYTQRWAGERWPEVPPDRDEEPPRTGRRRDEYDDWSEEPPPHDERPIVNPYAIVALVAALILVFPVAIVFGLIAFGHPRGRFLAGTAILLGVAEVALLAALVLSPRNTPGGVFSRVGDAVGEVTGGQRTAEPPVSPTSGTSESTQTSSPGRSAPPPPSVPASGAAAAPPAAEVDTACPEPALLGVAADGGTLLCLTDSASVTGYQWSGPYRVAETVRAEDASCTGAATARTAAGYALVCENGTWTLWSS